MPMPEPDFFPSAGSPSRHFRPGQLLSQSVEYDRQGMAIQATFSSTPSSGRGCGPSGGRMSCSTRRLRMMNS